MENENGQKVRRWMFLGLIPEGTALASIAVSDAGRTTYSDDVIRASLLTLAARAFVPQPVMGKTADQLKAYVYGKDPVTGRPVICPEILRLRAPSRWSSASRSATKPPLDASTRS